ncbi:MAG: mechanosensitive ion channel family protein [Planctomycetota bacterium]|jgi:fumarate reductase subunit D
MLAALDYGNLIVEPIREMLTKMVGYLPTLLGALIILTVGWVVAKTLRTMVNRLLKVARFDSLAEKAGISQILSKGGLQTSAREVLSTLVYWLVIVMVLVMVVNALGLPQASNVLESLFAFIPSVISALFVLIVGMFLANFVCGIVRTAAGNASLPKPEVFAGVSRWAIIVFAGDDLQHHPGRCLPWAGPGLWSRRQRSRGRIPRTDQEKTRGRKAFGEGRLIELTASRL